MGREAFKRTGHEVPRKEKRGSWLDHHLYVCPKDSPSLAMHINFRNYLRKHPEAVAEYASLKEKLAEQFRTNRTAYTEGKTSFILGILERVISA